MISFVNQRHSSSFNNATEETYLDNLIIVDMRTVYMIPIECNEICIIHYV